MQKTLQNLSSISLVFLVIFGGLHISASFLVAEKISNSILLGIFNIMDLPFLLSALLYGTARFALNAEQLTGNAKTALIGATFVSSIIFLLAIYLNFALPDAKLF